MDQRPRTRDITDALSADQAADMLGHSPRHVRRLIARGELEGTRDPYRTTRAAIDAYRFKQRTKGGDHVRPQHTEPDAPVDKGDGHLEMLVQRIERLAHENGRLHAEVSRLEAELAQCGREAGAAGRGERSERSPSPAGRGGGRPHNGHRVGVWGRVGLWLKKRG